MMLEEQYEIDAQAGGYLYGNPTFAGPAGRSSGPPVVFDTVQDAPAGLDQATSGAWASFGGEWLQVYPDDLSGVMMDNPAAGYDPDASIYVNHNAAVEAGNEEPGWGGGLGWVPDPIQDAVESGYAAVSPFVERDEQGGMYQDFSFGGFDPDVPDITDTIQDGVSAVKDGVGFVLDAAMMPMMMMVMMMGDRR